MSKLERWLIHLGFLVPMGCALTALGGAHEDTRVFCDAIEAA